MAKKCIECGLCRTACPVLRVTGSETLGPRGRVLQARQEIKDKLFYACTLCKNCEVACPLKLELEKDFREYRAELVKADITTESNTEMINNVRAAGNPVGKAEEGKLPKKLYCC